MFFYFKLFIIFVFCVFDTIFHVFFDIAFYFYLFIFSLHFFKSFLNVEIIHYFIIITIFDNLFIIFCYFYKSNIFFFNKNLIILRCAS